MALFLNKAWLCLLLALFPLVWADAYSPDHRFAFDEDKPEFLENAVPCLSSSIRYRKRPDSVVLVTTHVSIISLSEFSAANMDLTTDIFLMQRWRDPRCAFRSLPKQGSTLTLYSTPGGEKSHPGLNNLWRPDTHILNAKTSVRPEIVTKIKNTGIVSSRTRITSKISCPMDLRLFPADRQTCSLVIQSSAHPSTELQYRWVHGNATKLNFVQGLEYQDRMTPEIRLLGYRFRTAVTRPNPDNDVEYDQVIMDIFIERPLGYFLWEVYMPASFIVIISFTSFWLERSATPARVSLGVTTVLTITTLLSSANVNLPATAYPKAIGVFLAGCFVFTFLAFLEYSAASYLERRRSLLVMVPKTSVCSETHPHHVVEAPGSSPQKVRRRTLAGIRGNLVDPQGHIRSSAVDLYSRILFPLAFVLFQFIYWMILFLSSPPLPEGVTLLTREDGSFNRHN